uniref:P14 n=1 Tax=Galleria mellonella TaxID=7137 RepID=A0A3G1T1S7_GALME|nr:P14 [Galleria mellonella]
MENNKIIIYLLYISLSITAIIADEDQSDFLSNERSVLLFDDDDDQEPSIEKNDSDNDDPDGALKCSKHSTNLMLCILTKKGISSGWKVDISDVSIPNTLPEGSDNMQAWNKISGALDDWITNIFSVILP